MSDDDDTNMFPLRSKHSHRFWFPRRLGERFANESYPSAYHIHRIHTCLWSFKFVPYNDGGSAVQRLRFAQSQNHILRVHQFVRSWCSEITQLGPLLTDYYQNNNLRRITVSDYRGETTHLRFQWDYYACVYREEFTEFKPNPFRENYYDDLKNDWNDAFVFATMRKVYECH